MSEKDLPDPEQIAKNVEGGVRKFFERVGGALDFALRRPSTPQARTDLTALIPQIERAIDENLRTEATKTLAPNLIELRYDYETYSQLPAKRAEYLTRELRLSVYEYIHNRRYGTKGDVQVNVVYDMFTRKLTIKALFPDEAASSNAIIDAGSGQPATAAPVVPAAPKTFAVRLQNSQYNLAAKPGTRLNVGRSQDNQLVLASSSVSSIHAAFIRGANDAIWLTDLGSSNGTFVNDVQIPMGDKVIVKDGDNLRFGDIELALTLSS